MYTLLGGAFLGWALGANDAANVFGTAVSSRIVRYRTAVLLAAGFMIAGAVAQGGGGMRTLGGLTEQSPISALVVTAAAGAIVMSMTRSGLPVSSSQAVIGAIIGMGLGRGKAVNLLGLTKVFACWVGTPVAAAVLSALLYPLLAAALERLKLPLVARSRLMKLAMVVAGCWGAYALGGNAVANVAGVFQRAGVLGGQTQLLALVGGASMALGVLTFSRHVMFTVGTNLVSLDAFSALVAVTAQAATLYLYALIGVPVSTAQAIVGAVLGIGLLKGVRTVNFRTLLRILYGWVATPLMAGVLAYLLALLCC